MLSKLRTDGDIGQTHSIRLVPMLLLRANSFHEAIEAMQCSRVLPQKILRVQPPMTARVAQN